MRQSARLQDYHLAILAPSTAASPQASLGLSVEGCSRTPLRAGSRWEMKIGPDSERSSEPWLIEVNMLSRCIRAPATACLLRGVRLEIQPKLGQAQGRLRSLAFGGCGSPQSPQALRNDLIEAVEQRPAWSAQAPSRASLLKFEGKISAGTKERPRCVYTGNPDKAWPTRPLWQDERRSTSRSTHPCETASPSCSRSRRNVRACSRSTVSNPSVNQLQVSATM